MVKPSLFIMRSWQQVCTGPVWENQYKCSHYIPLSFCYLLLCCKSPQNTVPKIDNYFTILTVLWVSDLEVAQAVSCHCSRMTGTWLGSLEWLEMPGRPDWDHVPGAWVLIITWVPQLLSTWHLLWLERCNCEESNKKRTKKNYKDAGILAKWRPGLHTVGNT